MNFEQLQSQHTIQFFLTVLSFHFFIFPVIPPSLLYFYYICLLSFVLYSVLSHFFLFYFSLFLLSQLSESVFVTYNIFPFLYLHLFLFSLNSKRKSTKYNVSRTSPFYSGKNHFHTFLL
jgi:hypothetical protein